MKRLGTEAWYEISARELAIEIGEEDNISSASALQKARGIKYGDSSYQNSELEERLLGLKVSSLESFWQEFFLQNTLLVDNKIIISIGGNSGLEMKAMPLSTAKLTINTDISFPALKRGKDQNNGNLLQVDGNHISFAKNSADIVFSLRTLIVFREQEQKDVLKELFRIISPGGKLVFSVPGGFLNKSGKIIHGQLVNGSVDKKKPIKDQDQLNQLASKTGFTFKKNDNRGIELFSIFQK
ncbi:class I SAM-dependent methyltransferase [Patescibacteria group bacterium]|nr:class I SAM-dependent methyltransferase [Patescibacteria group bacterium]